MLDKHTHIIYPSSRIINSMILVFLPWMNEWNGPMRIHIGLVPIYAPDHKWPSWSSINGDHSPHTSRGIRLSGTSIRCALLKDVPDLHHKPGRLPKTQGPRPQALTISVKALSRYRLCGQAPYLPKNILVYQEGEDEQKPKGIKAYALRRSSIWAT